jgi:fucose permease
LISIFTTTCPKPTRIIKLEKTGQKMTEITLQEQLPTKTTAGRIRWQIGLAFSAFILIGMNDGAFGVLLPSLQTYYSVDKATIGLLFLTSAAGYLVAAFSSGLLLEWLGRKRYLTLGPAVLLTGAALFSLKPPFIVGLASTLLIGFGVAIIDAGLNTYIASLPRNTALLNYLHAFYGVGALLGPIVASSVLAFGWQWNTVYYLWFGISLVLLFSFGLIYNQATTPTTDFHSDSTKGESNVLAAALKLRVAWLAALFLLFYVGTEVSLGNWSYSFLTEDRHEAALLSGWVVSGYWLGLTIGRLTLGHIGQRIGNRRLIQGCLAGVAIGVVLAWLVPIGLVTALALWLTGFSLGPIFPTTIGLISERVTPRLVPSAIGFAASLGSMGAAFFPWLAGNLAEAVGLWTLLPYVVALSTIMFAIWLMLNRKTPAEK